MYFTPSKSQVNQGLIKYEVRRLKRREHHLSNVIEKLIAALTANKHKDFWKDIKRIRSVHQKPTTPHINGLSNDNDIANLFADQFAKTLNICTDTGHVSSTQPDCSSADLLQHYISPECVSVRQLNTLNIRNPIVLS